MKYRIVASVLAILVIVGLYVLFAPSGGQTSSPAQSAPEEPTKSYSGFGK
jgi:hypothetical protein